MKTIKKTILESHSKKLPKNGPWKRIEELREQVGDDTKILDIFVSIASKEQLEELCNEIEVELDIW